MLYFDFREDRNQMTIQEAINVRHSVRAYRNEPIEAEKRRQLVCSEVGQESILEVRVFVKPPNA